jgi:fumarylpyruvate hydrolase
MSYIFSPAPQVVIPVIGESAFFPVRRVYCVGRNYAAHAKEMGFSGREEPFYFIKPTDTIIPVPPGQVGQTKYPALTTNLHHEIELVVAISKSGSNISVDDAVNHIYGYAVGLDMTRRDLQIAMREKGRPWEIGKSYDFSAPISHIYSRSAVGELLDKDIELTVNGVIRQKSNTVDLIFSVSEIIADLSRYFDMQPGDLIFTGTPDGVAPVVTGDLLVGKVAGLGELKVSIT